MDESWKEVLLDHRDAILNSADPHNVVLNRLIDHLKSRRIIQQDQIDLVKNETLTPVSRDRFIKLLDFVSSEGCKAFDELCNAFDAFGTEDKSRLATTLRRDTDHRQMLRAVSEVQHLREERDAARDQLRKLTLEQDEWRRDKEDMTEQLATARIQLEQLEKRHEDQEQCLKTLTEEMQECGITLSRQVFTIDQLGHEIRTLKNDAEVRRTRLALCTEEVKLIHSMDEHRTVSGLTTLLDELYVHYDADNYLTVYDTQTYRVQRRVDVPGLSGKVNDVTSCSWFRCLYVSDHGINCIHRVDVSKTVAQWSVHDEPGGLSINSLSNVLVTCYVVGKVKEFTTDGQLVHEINLDRSIAFPMHTIELGGDQYVVCHGYFEEDKHGVSIVNSAGGILHAYGGMIGSDNSQLNRPIRLALISNLLLCVSDSKNHHMLILTPTLGLMRQLVLDLRYPCGIWFDEQSARLYVADNKLMNDEWVGGHVRVYGV